MVHGSTGGDAGVRIARAGRRRACCVAVWAWLLPALAPRALAQAPPALRAAESQVKAAYLLQFLNYVDWPDKAFERDDSPFVVGLSGADAVAAELTALAAGRQVQHRRVDVRRLRSGDSPAGLHVLFIGGERTPAAAALLAAARARPMLVVTDSEDLFAHGGMVQFVIVEQRVRFDVALRPPDDANGLRISSRLLGVARRVIGAGS